MKKMAIVLVYILFSVKIFSQVNINIVVITQNVADSEKIFIAGNTVELGLWNPGMIELIKINDSTWTKSFSITLNTDLLFKFTKGDWKNEALDENFNIPDNHILTAINDTTLIFKISNWNNGQKNITEQITGNVKYHIEFTGSNILPRNIIVWLPPTYDSLIEKKYPVLYMHDGQNIIDPQTSAFGIDWEIDETADSLIKADMIEEIIIVGIYNTYKRSSEYKNTEDGFAYIKFIVDELKPFIDSTYRTLPEKEYTATSGSSLGGLISFMLVWEYSDIFSKAACLSPAFKIDDIDYVTTVKNYTGDLKKVMLYIDNGGIGLEKELQPGITEMLEVLKSKGYFDGEHLLWYKDENAEHNENAWAKRVHRFLEFLFPKIN
jgi:predicted alpha/beta superfamily hydrolase